MDLQCIWERSCDHEFCILHALVLHCFCPCIGVYVYFFCIIFIIIENDCNEYIGRNHCVYTIRGLKQSWLSVVRIKFLFVCYFIFTGAWYTADGLVLQCESVCFVYKILRLWSERAKRYAYDINYKVHVRKHLSIDMRTMCVLSPNCTQIMNRPKM